MASEVPERRAPGADVLLFDLVLRETASKPFRRSSTRAPGSARTWF